MISAIVSGEAKLAEVDLASALASATPTDIYCPVLMLGKLFLYATGAGRPVEDFPLTETERTGLIARIGNATIYTDAVVQIEAHASAPVPKDAYYRVET